MHHARVSKLYWIVSYKTLLITHTCVDIYIQESFKIFPCEGLVPQLQYAKLQFLQHVSVTSIFAIYKGDAHRAIQQG